MRVHRRSKRRAAASVEFAVCLPVLCTILLGVWDLGRLVEVNQLLNNATREGARHASSGSGSVSEVQDTVRNTLIRAGIDTNGLSVSVVNLTTGNADPRTANQLDKLQVTVTLPTNNVRFLLAGNLPGPGTLTATSIWMSMRDIPVAEPGGIPQG